MSGRRPRIGYYVHHHGSGHASRAGAIAAAMRCEVTLLSSLALHPPERRIDTVRLPYEGAGGTVEAPADLHFAPLGSAGLRRRMAAIAAWVERAAPDLFVVDVSVEVAAFVRLLGVPVVYVRQTGDRSDEAHRLAYRWSSALLAPYPDLLEPADTPAWIAEKTLRAGAVTRFDGEPRPPAARVGAAARRVLVVGARAARVAPRLAAAVPSWQVVSPGLESQSRLPNLAAIEARDLDLRLLASCSVVVAGAGANIVGEAAFARCGLVSFPEPRPFGEQVERGNALRRLDAAVVLDGDPPPQEWAAHLSHASAARSRLARWSDGAGAGRAAVMLERLAQGDGAGGEAVASSRSRDSSQRTRPRPSSSSSQPRAGHSPQRRR
jgi:hypothetical protein